ncbi:MAG TPA: LLM class F420-dependent oxidoreductase, partial [Roseiflexaceae bacterium]|nr:LLM class F420-dependent oxidoreductase [Roseiflexaceae bacterium]
FGTPEVFKHKNEVLDQWCAEIGRDPSAIERSTATYADRLGQLDQYRAAGAQHIILEWGAPFDITLVQRLVAWRDAQH